MSKRYFFFIVLLSVLVAITSCGSFIFSDLYSKETADWQAQSIAQDLFDLIFAVPALLISALLLRRGFRRAFFCLAGVQVFLIYTFIIYTMSVHFNRFFLLYCLTLAASIYSFIFLVHEFRSARIRSWFAQSQPVTSAIIYLLFFAGLFYFLWLSDIIPAIAKNIIPAQLEQSGLFTNPVHVIDLSFLLPGFVIAAILLKKRQAHGYLFAPIIMTFSVVMTLSIATLVFYEYSKGLVPELTVAFAMIFFSAVSIFIYLRFTKRLIKKEA